MLGLPDILKDAFVFPCQVGGKLPATKNGWKDASRDATQIAEWQRANPDFNWAVSTGLSKLFVFDIDPAGMDWWHKLLERDPAIKEAVDRAFTVRTPRGGLHIYFRGEGPSTASRIAEGIDTRGGILRDGEIISGGYVVLPGSRTKDGTYEALPGGVIAPLPDFMRSIVPERTKSDTLGLSKNPDADKPRNVQWAIDLLKNYVASGRIAIQGRGGDNLTFQVAASILDKAISPGLCFDLMWEHWNPACSPPWGDWELETKIRNAANHGEDTAGGVKGFLANEDAFSQFSGQEFEPPVKTPKKSRFEPMRLEDARRDVRPARWLIPGFLPAEGVGVLYGLSGSYKTFVALDWALCLAHGIPGQWGAPPVKHRVLFLAGENSYALQQERVDSWCAKYERNPNDGEFVIVRGVPAYGDSESWTVIRDGLEKMNFSPDLIVVDTLTRLLSGLDENSNNDQKQALKLLEDMAYQYEAFTLGIGHTGKDQGRGIRGGQVAQDNSDTVLFVSKKGTDGINLVVKKLKEVDIPSEPFYLRVEKIGPSIVLNRETSVAEAEQGPGKSRYPWASVQEVVKMLQGMGREVATTTLAQTIAGDHGIDASEVRKQLLKSDDLKWLHPEGNIWKIPPQEWDL